MIKRDDVQEELEKAEKTMEGCKDIYTKAVYKLVTVILKVVMNIRTNTTLIMEKLGIQKIVPKRKEEEKIEDKKE